MPVSNYDAYQVCRFKCSCHPYKYGQVIHSWGVVMNNCLSWVCLRCFQAHVTFFEQQGEKLVYVHDESFACINDLPECLWFSWLEWDDDGHPVYWDREMTDEDDEKIIALRQKLDLPHLDESFYERIQDAIARTVQP